MLGIKNAAIGWWIIPTQIRTINI